MSTAGFTWSEPSPYLCMESTFDYREQQISVTLTFASQIFEEYPRYVDFENGSLILTIFIENIRTHTPAWKRVSSDGSRTLWLDKRKGKKWKLQNLLTNLLGH
ncbi:Denn domain-containing-like protein [Daphnia magna]|uniref:Denn domain-containing-like protein n=1 Tax=Daphnia magna TaxID=35525 RepID=A0A162CU99_9CRUS|nr:Denn domain-containing-like protein [Daphnia magna]